MNHAASGRARRMHEGWLGRNEQLLAKVKAVGEKGAWYIYDQKPGEVWQELLVSSAATVCVQVAQLLKPNLQANCDAMLSMHEEGTYDLARFPNELRTIGIANP